VGAVVWSAVRHPVGYWSAVRDHKSDVLKLCWIPSGVSTICFEFAAPGLQAGNTYHRSVPLRNTSDTPMDEVR
jgi:phospholipid/cholesterol/gamma-HCH transport system permease protein